MIDPQFAPPETNVLSVTVRATVSAESLTLMMLKLGGSWMVSAPRMPWTLPALPTLIVSSPPVLRLVATPVASTLIVSLPDPALMFTALVSMYL